MLSFSYIETDVFIETELYYYNLRGDRVDQLHQQHQADRQSPVCVCVCVRACEGVCVHVCVCVRDHKT